MDFKLSVLLMAVFFGLGIVGTYAVVPESEVIVINLPGEEVIVNQIVEIMTTDTSLLLDLAVSDFLAEVDDERDLRRCDGDKYTFSEISEEEVSEDYLITIEDKDYQVDFEVELRYKESDLRSCYETFSVEAFYEDSKDVEFRY